MKEFNRRFPASVLKPGLRIIPTLRQDEADLLISAWEYRGLIDIPIAGGEKSFLWAMHGGRAHDILQHCIYKLGYATPSGELARRRVSQMSKSSSFSALD